MTFDSAAQKNETAQLQNDGNLSQRKVNKNSSDVFQLAKAAKAKAANNKKVNSHKNDLKGKNSETLVPLGRGQRKKTPSQKVQESYGGDASEMYKDSKEDEKKREPCDESSLLVKSLGKRPDINKDDPENEYSYEAHHIVPIAVKNNLKKSKFENPAMWDTNVSKDWNGIWQPQPVKDNTEKKAIGIPWHRKGQGHNKYNAHCHNAISQYAGNTKLEDDEFKTIADHFRSLCESGSGYLDGISATEFSIPPVPMDGED